MKVVHSGLFFVFVFFFKVDICGEVKKSTGGD